MQRSMQRPQRRLDSLSSEDSDTDTLGRAILKHERHTRRVGGATAAEDNPSSSMSRTHTQRIPRPLSYHKADQHDLTNGSAQVLEQRTPDLNIPRHWGRRTRPEDAWIRDSRIPVSAEKQATAKAKIDKDTIVPHRTSFTGDDYWDDGERAPGDDTPPSMRRRRPLTQPTSLRHMNSRLEAIVLTQEAVVTKPAPQAATTALPAPRRLDMDARARREQLHARLERFRAAASRNREKIATDSSSDKENVPTYTSKPSTQVLTERDEVRSSNSHNRSDSLQMLERLAKVTQSPPRRSQPLGELPIEAPTPLVTGGWIDTPQASKITHAVPQIKIDKPVEENDSTDQLPVKQSVQPPLMNKLEDIKQGTSDEVSTAVPSSLQKAYEAGKSMIQALTQKEPVTMDHDHQDNVQPEKAGAHHHNDTSTTNDAQAQNNTNEPVATKAHTHPGNKQSTMPHSNALDKYISKVFKKSSESLTEQSKDAGIPGKEHSTTIHSSPSSTNGQTMCEHCGQHKSAWKRLWFELCNQFYTQEESLSRIRLSPLGTFVIIWLSWLLLESILCSHFCKPRYTTTMVGYGVNHHTPIFPFVIPTLLLKPFSYAWLPLAKQLSWTKSALGTLLTGEAADVYALPSRIAKPSNQTMRSAYRSIKQPARWLSSVTAVATATGRRVLNSATDAVDEMGRMW